MSSIRRHAVSDRSRLNAGNSTPRCSLERSTLAPVVLKQGRLASTSTPPRCELATTLTHKDGIGQIEIMVARSMYETVKQAIQDVVAPDLERIKGEITAIREGDIAGLRAELGAVRTEIGAVRTELKAEI